MEDEAGDRTRYLTHPARFEHSAAVFRTPPPELGEHSDAVLREAGLGAAEIDALRSDGVLG